MNLEITLKDISALTNAISKDDSDNLDSVPGFLIVARELGISRIDRTVIREYCDDIFDTIYDDSIDIKNNFSYSYTEHLSKELRVKFDYYFVSDPLEMDNISDISFNMLKNVITLKYCKNVLEIEVDYQHKFDHESGILNLYGFSEEYIRLSEIGMLDKYVLVYSRIKNTELLHSLFEYSDVKNIVSNYAKMLNSLVEKDEICARAGTEEFCMLIKNVYLEERLAIFAELPVGFKLNGEESVYNISLVSGVVECSNDDSITMDAALSKAAGVLELAGREGRDDLLYYEESVVKRQAEKNSLEIRMPLALQKGQFVVYFQPKVEVATRTLVGAEALIRWNRNGTIVPPLDFIPLAEKTGFIRNLDMFVLEKTCSQIKKWTEEGKRVVPISVNFSKYHLRFPNFTNKIMDIINKYGINPSLIEVEFTETAYMDDYNSIKHAIYELKNNGVLVSMDDFGFGYSSLALLRNLDFDILKLDKSIVSNDGDKRCHVILENVMKMAKSLSMTVICEGVEDEHVLNNLEMMGCDIIQGFYFDRPLPIDDFIERLDNPIYKDIK